MSIKKSVFGSASERELFTAIDSQWGDRFAVYPSLPFANIIDLTRLELTPAERSFLLKTSVDYTLCTKRGRPLLSIEFDGLSHGFSREGRYVPIHPSADPKRTEKLDLKVRIAAQVGYPLFVISYHEKNPIGEGTHLTIVDGIIGQVLARLDFTVRLNRYLAEEREAIADMDPEFRDEYFQDLIVSAEVEAELEWDPIAREAAKLRAQISMRGIASSHSWKWLEDPPLPELPAEHDAAYLEALKARMEAMKRTVRIGCKATIRTVFGDVSETVWIRNIEHGGVHPLGLTENMAMLLACKRVLELADQGALDQTN